jgi:hypothetical protein
MLLNGESGNKKRENRVNQKGKKIVEEIDSPAVEIEVMEDDEDDVVITKDNLNTDELVVDRSVNKPSNRLRCIEINCKRIAKFNYEKECKLL